MRPVHKRHEVVFKTIFSLHESHLVQSGQLYRSSRVLSLIEGVIRWSLFVLAVAGVAFSLVHRGCRR